MKKVVGPWIAETEWQKKGDHFKSFRKENKVGKKEYAKEKSYTDLGQVIDDLNSRVNQE